MSEYNDYGWKALKALSNDLLMHRMNAFGIERPGDEAAIKLLSDAALRMKGQAAKVAELQASLNLASLRIKEYEMGLAGAANDMTSERGTFGIMMARLEAALQREQAAESTLAAIRDLPRYAILGGQQKRVLYGRTAIDANTRDSSELYVKADELQAELDKAND